MNDIWNLWPAGGRCIARHLAFLRL